MILMMILMMRTLTIIMSKKLWQHQKYAIEKYSNKSYFGLLFDMGLGKTLTAKRFFILTEDNTRNGNLHRSLVLRTQRIVFRLCL